MTIGGFYKKIKVNGCIVFNELTVYGTRLSKLINFYKRIV
jgi:hypothetical protein